MDNGAKECRQRGSDLKRFKSSIARFNAADFDGHTEFSILSYEQKLCWLAYCAHFFENIKKENMDKHTLSLKANAELRSKNFKNL